MNRLAKVRRSINTLEYPLWTPSKNIAKLTAYENEKGYLIQGSEGLPTSRDIDILNHILYKAQSLKTMEVHYKSIYELIMDLGFNTSKISYEAINNSITKWIATFIVYPKGTYYGDKKRYDEFKKLNIINEFLFKKGEITISLTPAFMNLNNTEYCKLIPVKIYQSLTPVSKRLYEILSKNFYRRSEWEIDFKKLIDKLAISKEHRYKSSIIRDVSKAIIEINGRFGSNYSLSHINKDKEDSIIGFTNEKILS